MNIEEGVALGVGLGVEGWGGGKEGDQFRVVDKGGTLLVGHLSVAVDYH